MDVIEHYKSIDGEINALKDRIANVVSHNGARGEWREAVVRGILRRYLPATLGVGHGFIMTADGNVTTQLDIIVFDQNYPRYVQEGEFIIITSDAVRAIIEVKSSTDSEDLGESLKKLSAATALIRRQILAERDYLDHKSIWSGYFALTQNTVTRNNTLKEYLRDGCTTEEGYINGICLGPERFVRFWDTEEADHIDAEPRSWRQYDLTQQAYGYFIMNLLACVCSESVRSNHHFWFPAQGKGQGTEIHVLGQNETTSTRRGRRARR